MLLALAELVPTVGFALLPSWNREVQPPSGTAPIAIGCLLALDFDRLAAMRFWRSAGWPIALVFVDAIQLHMLNADRRIHGLQLVSSCWWRS